MGIFSWVTGFFSGDQVSVFTADETTLFHDDDSLLNSSAIDIESSMNMSEINPASGLPMTNGIGGFDVAGNPYGVDYSHEDLTPTGCDDSFSVGTSDSFGCGVDDSSSFGTDDSFDCGINDSSSFGSGFDDW